MAKRNTYKYTFLKSQLADVPEEQLRLLLVSASILNELNYSTRMVFFSANHADLTDPASEAATAQSLYFIKILIGKTWECWEAIRKFLQSSKPCRSISEQLDSRSKDALEQLNSKFGSKTFFPEVRKELAFHLDGDAILEGFADFPNDTMFATILGPTNLNTLFLFAEDASARKLLNTSGATTPSQHNLDQMATEALRTAGLVSLVAEGVATTILRQHAPQLFDHSTATEIDIDNCPSIHEVILPFLVKNPQDGDS